jgi:type IV secretory pathway VirD2 relaxase
VDQREFAFGTTSDGTPVMGRIAAKGLAGETHDKPYVPTDGLDGRVHSLPLRQNVNMSELPVGGVLEVRPIRESIADRNIATIAQGRSRFARSA